MRFTRYLWRCGNASFGAFGHFTHGFSADDPPVVVVADFANSSRDRHAVIPQSATDAVAVEMARHGAYDVISRRQVEKAAADLGLRAPYTVDDFARIAREVGATQVVSGEVRDVTSTIHGVEREVTVAIIVRVKDAESGDMLNGAAVRASVTAPGASKSEGELGIDAAAMAASRAVAQIEAYQPITGTIMNSVGNGAIMLNRGVSHGVKSKQEFIVLRAGKRIGRVQAKRPSASYTELTIIDNSGAIQPQDRVISLFPEPKLGK